MVYNGKTHEKIDDLGWENPYFWFNTHILGGHQPTNQPTNQPLSAPKRWVSIESSGFLFVGESSVRVGVFFMAHDGWDPWEEWYI